MKIGIVTATQKEIMPLIERKNAVKVEGEIFSVYNYGENGKDFYIGILPNVGEVFASAVTSLLISKYNAEIILNFGVVGALKKDISLLSTVYVKDVVHYDMDTSPIDNVEKGRYLLFDDVYVKTDETLLLKALKVESLPVVRCASADKFVEDSLQKQRLAEEYQADVCDMESAAIAIVCKYARVPCLMLKAVSDSLTGGGKEYHESVQIAVDSYMRFVDELVSAL